MKTCIPLIMGVGLAIGTGHAPPASAGEVRCLFPSSASETRKPIRSRAIAMPFPDRSVSRAEAPSAFDSDLSVPLGEMVRAAPPAPAADPIAAVARREGLVWSGVHTAATRNVMPDMGDR